jgi:hypothetical protein
MRMKLTINQDLHDAGRYVSVIRRDAMQALAIVAVLLLGVPMKSYSQACAAQPPALQPYIGNVYLSGADVQLAGSETLAYHRHFNSADRGGGDGVTGWRHSVNRNVRAAYQPPAKSFAAASAMTSPQYATPKDPCQIGFITIKGAAAARSLANGPRL